MYPMFLIMEASANSLQDLLQIVRDKICFKAVLEQSEDIVKGINNQCLNLDKRLREFNFTTRDIQLQTRDDILCKLSHFWELSHAVITTGKENICPSLLKFFHSLCIQQLSQVLTSSMRSCDHFIAFQAHKVLKEILGAFPEIVMQTAFQELISSCLTQNLENGKWTVMYVMEIFKGVLHFIKSQERKAENPEGSKKCGCTCLEKNLLGRNRLDAEAILDLLCGYWIDLSDQCLSRSSVVEIDKEDKQMDQGRPPGFAIFQQTIASFLSFGSMLVQACYGKADDKISLPIYTSEESHTGISHTSSEISHSKDSESSLLEVDSTGACTSKNEDEIQFHLSHQRSSQIQSNNVIQESSQMLTKSCGSKLMESIEKIVEKLLDADSCKFSLQLRRTIVQFLNDVIAIGYQNSSCFLQTELDQKIQVRLVTLGIFLLTNIGKIFNNVPRVRGVIHFGGEGFRNVSSEESVPGKLVCDKVFARKVLLLVLKSVLMMVHAKTVSKALNYELLKQSLEVWLNFVVKEISELSERVYDDEPTQNIAALVIFLFADQDDELMTALLYLFNLYQGLFLTKSFLPSTEWTKHLHHCLNPHKFFLEFLYSIHFDHSLLLDFLTSSETCFLQYFLSYLRHMANDWCSFLETVEQVDDLSEKKSQKSPSRNKVPSEKTTFSQDSGQVMDTSTGVDACYKEFSMKISGNLGSDFQNWEHNVDENEFSEGGLEMDWSSGHDCHQVKDVNNVENALIANYSALSSIKSNYGELSSSDDDTADHDYDKYDNHNNYDKDSNLYKDGPGHNYDNDDSNDQDEYGNCNVHRQAHNGDLLKDDSDESDHAKDGGNHDKFLGITTSSTDGCVTFLNDSFLDKLMSCLIRLRFSIERMVSKQLFPYPVEALLRVMRYIEGLYEGDIKWKASK